MSTPLLAESVVGADKFICATVVQEICASDQPCTDGGPSWNTSIPEFLEIDLKKKTVSTTEASGEKRSSKVELILDGGLIVMHGFERGKAFVIVVNESTGVATASVTADGEVISVFSTCTPK
jgi:hypothetical protein